MPVTILARTASGTTYGITGVATHVTIAGERIKCVRTRAPGSPPVLTHYASGSVLISAGAWSAANLALRIRTGGTPTDRQVQDHATDRLCARLGADRVLATLNSAPILNH